MSIDRRIKTIWYIYTVEYYSAIKNNEIIPLPATWMDLVNIILSEVSQTEKDKYMYHLYVESKKMIQMNLFTKQKQTLKTKFMVTNGEIGGRDKR